MTGRRWSAVAVLASVALVVPVAAVPAAVHAARDAIRLLAGEIFVMGGTNTPLPDQGYLDSVVAGYLTGPGLAGLHPEALPTPEQFCPIVCGAPLDPATLPPLPAPLDPNDFPSDLTFGSSVFTGAGILSNAVRDAGLSVTDPVGIFGYSQSATVASVTMNDLIANAGTGNYPTLEELANLHVVLIGDPNNPIGGILDRFQFPDTVGAFSLSPAMQHVPFLNIPLGTAPTPTDVMPTAIYSGEYDGWANFPQDPLNVLALVNALIGIQTVHPYYLAYTADQLDSAIPVGTIGQTDFFMIPQNLPILQFMYNGGTAGQFFGDAFSPFLRLIIDWGYGNAGDPAVNGMYQIPGGEFINGSAYQQAIGVAGGPWAETPAGELYQGNAFTDVSESGVAGLLMKMDPLQMLAGGQNALVQTLVGPWADVAAAAGDGTLDPDAVSTVTAIEDALRFLVGYDLVNFVDQALLGAWGDGVDLLQELFDGIGLQTVDLAGIIGPDALLTGPLIPGEPVIDLVGLAFTAFNFFGA